MKREKKLIIIGVISFVITLVIFFTQKHPGNRGIFSKLFEIALMTGLVFIVIAINFFAISFVIRKLRELFSGK